jgi:hypothetical protein
MRLSDNSPGRHRLALVMHHHLARLGGPPPAYLALRLESSGSDPETDLIVDAGYALVVDGEVTAQGGWLLDWTKAPRLADLDWLRQRLMATRSAVERTPRRYYPYTLERLAAEGAAPEAVLEDLAGMFLKAADAGMPLVSHNAYASDAVQLQAHFHHALGAPFDPGPDGLLDTGAAAKGAMANELPRAAESLRDYGLRVHARPVVGVFWSLPHVWVDLGVGSRHQMSPPDRRDAALSARMVHLVFQECLRAARDHPEEAPAGGPIPF